MAALCLFLLALLCHVTVTSAAKTALLVVDIQNCFTPGGSLAITGGDDVIDVINVMRSRHGHLFDLTVLSQDWHCADHVSFASQHEGYSTYDVISLDYDSQGRLCRSEGPSRNGSVHCPQVAHHLNQTLWPDHCIMGTEDAALHTSLNTASSDVIIRKGYRCNIDSYSVFYDNGGFTETELRQTLEDAEVKTLVIGGLARDYCVFWTAKDAQRLGYTVYVVLDATKPVAESTGRKAVEEMRKLGIKVIDSKDVGDVFKAQRNTAGAATYRTVGTLCLTGIIVLCLLLSNIF